MPAPNVRMRLTVEVLPLAEKDAHGPHRTTALAAFQPRKFALPVQPDDTFELVWSRIEQRYKTNYLNATQAAAFTIKKLQDAYDCDLDLGDTVSSIFECETDRRMHVIKVVPSFINREFSVPPTSHLRPGQSTKRHADFNADHTSKRRRIEAHQLDNIQEEREPSPNRPIQSTETDHEEQRSTGGSREDDHLNRSRSGDSLVFVHNAQTGDAEFSTAVIKTEPTDADPPIFQDVTRASVQPLETASQDETSNRRSKLPLAPSKEAAEQQTTENTSETTNAPIQNTDRPEETVQDEQQVAASPGIDSQEAAVHKSPVSSVEQVATTPPPAATRRKEVYELPSSPEFMQNKPTPAKGGKTYGRSPRTPKVIQNEVDLLNKARILSGESQEKNKNPKPTPTSSSKKARSFQLPKPDEIESTPQEAAASNSKQRTQSESSNDGDNDLTTSFLDKTKGDMPNGSQTPVRKTSKPAKPGSLRKASIKSLLTTPGTPASPANARRSSRLETAKSSSLNTRARKQLDANKEVATPPKSSNAKRGAMAGDTPSRMQYLEDLLSRKQSTPIARPSESSPSATRKSEEASTPLPTGGQQIKETPKPSKPTVETPRPSHPAQSPALKATPIRSPVPLPANVAHLARNATGSSEGEPSPSRDDAVFKKPALRAQNIPNGSPVVKRATRSASSDQRSTSLRSEVSLPDAVAQVAQAEADTPTPKLSAPGESKPRTRSEVPLPANVRHLRGNITPQKEPNGSIVSPTPTPAVQAEVTTKSPHDAPAPVQTTPVVMRTTESLPPEQTSVEEPAEEAIVISSRESSSTRYSDSLEEQPEHAADNAGGAVETSAPQTEQRGASAQNGATTTGDIDADEGYGEDEVTVDLSTGAQPAVADPQDSTTVNQPTIWNTQSWGFGNIGQQDGAAGNNEETPNREDEPADETERKSRSASVASSTRSSPAVARQPARFLSHSPTPDASESEDTSDEASVGRSKGASLEPTNENEESDSSSSSESSDDEDVDMPDLPAESTTDSNTNVAPPSSPPLDAPKSTPLVPESSQPNALPHKTPIPFPSSQAPPHSSQSVSAQAAERRRYTGFRSLREQLAETRAPKTTTQTKTFDPRTMSLNKLAKGKPLVALGGDDDSSDEESSSSSDSDSD